MMAFTKTPWGIIHAGTIWGIAPVTRDGEPRNGPYTEDICDMGTQRNEWRENASLILAAPELFQALQQLHTQLMADVPGYYKGALRKKVEAALEKALSDEWW